MTRISVPPCGLAAQCLVIAAAMVVATARPAHACGGLFCNAQNPVNQSAERILFVDGGDGRTTAAIEIQYQGSAERFAWVLPVADIENPDQDIRVSSTLALDRLQAATNPSYRLNRIVEGTCKDSFAGLANAGGGRVQDGGMGGPGAFEDEGGVVVEASGSVGPFDYEFIAVLPGTDDPTQAAIDWLQENDYDLAGGEPLLRPYLEMGMKLLAVRLTSGRDVGAIRPLMITYEGSHPAIPIRPTAVAAQDDMGVMVFVAGAARAIPKNYLLLELNEALIDWFNPNNTYGEVVNRAADEAGGHGFVTEYADDSATLADVIASQWERDRWADFQASADAGGSEEDLLYGSMQWSGWDGLLEAWTAALDLPAGVTAQDVLQCASCYLDGNDARVSLDRRVLVTALYEQVVRPMFDTDALLQGQPYVTRLYTTMSADEMTEDPAFDFNPDMGDVSNQHVADQYILCSPGLDQFEAPYRVELPTGEVIYGAEQGVWPFDLDHTDQPAARVIAQAGTSGQPAVVADNVEPIEQALSSSNAKVMSAIAGDDGCGCRAAGASGAARPPRGLVLLFPLAMLWLIRRSGARS